jgi:hypothetical protein
MSTTLLLPPGRSHVAALTLYSYFRRLFLVSPPVAVRIVSICLLGSHNPIVSHHCGTTLCLLGPLFDVQASSITPLSTRAPLPFSEDVMAGST